MTDIVAPQVRSRMMAGIRGADTRPEKTVRRILHAKGYRFRLNQASLPGRPDIVLKKHRITVFVHGCFWHGHRDCKYARVPGSNRRFWRSKLVATAQRDVRNERILLDTGWRVLTIWECAIRGGTEPLDRLPARIVRWIASRQKRGEIPKPTAR